MDVIHQLMVVSDKVRYRIFDILEMIDNPIEGEELLALKISNDNGVDIYFEIDIYLQNQGDYNVYHITSIDVDRYLDLMNEGKLIKLNKNKCRTIV